MKQTMKKLTVLLVATFAMIACNGNSESKESTKPVNSSSTQDVVSSEQKSSDPVEKSSEQPKSSDEPIHSSSDMPSSSEPVSSSSASSESQGQDEPGLIDFSKYILKHNAGETKEYFFEAECTNLGTKEGPGYSGTASESAMATSIDGESGACVTYLYAYGMSINFFVVAETDVTDAVLSARLGAEFFKLKLTPDTYTFRVDTVIQDQDLLDYCGNWDAGFLDYYTDLNETGGYFVNPWDCGEINIDPEGATYPACFDKYTITSKLNLKKGCNCISLITTNTEGPTGGTFASSAPCVDYISIKTSAQLGMYDIQENGQGDNAVHF